MFRKYFLNISKTFYILRNALKIIKSFAKVSRFLVRKKPLLKKIKAVKFKRKNSVKRINSRYRKVRKKRRKPWWKIYKFKFGLPVRGRKRFLMQRILFKIFSRKRRILGFQSVANKGGRQLKDGYNYRLEPWDYRALKRAKKAAPFIFRKRIKMLKFILYRLRIRKILLKSKFFYLNFKGFFRNCDFYFTNRMKRLVILNRDKIYYSKWGYVKFLKTRHNLFVSIYDRHHKLLHHTTAWASGSRRDPNRFSYKSLIFSARKLAARLWKLRFKKINVRLSSPINFHIRLFLKTLKIKRIKVLDVLNFIKVPHNGLRPQKSRTQS